MDAQEGVSNPTGAYGRGNITSMLLPQPNTLPLYGAAQSGKCNYYIPNDSTLSRWEPPLNGLCVPTTGSHDYVSFALNRNTVLQLPQSSGLVFWSRNKHPVCCYHRSVQDMDHIEYPKGLLPTLHQCVRQQLSQREAVLRCLLRYLFVRIKWCCKGLGVCLFTPS